MKNTTSLFNILHPLLGGRKKTIALATLLLFGFAGGAQAQSSALGYQG